MEAVVVRDGKNLKGRLLGVLLSITGRQIIGKAFQNTLKAIESRNRTS